MKSSLSSLSMEEELSTVFAEAKALHFTMLQGGISKTEARKRIDPLLARLNSAGAKIAKKYNVPYRKITYANLGEHF